MTPQELIKKQIENQNERLFSAPMVPIDRVTATTPEGQTYNLKEVNLSQSQTQLLKAVVEMIDEKEKKNTEFGFCKNCKYHQGDIGHEETCGSYNKALSDIKQNLLSIIKE